MQLGIALMFRLKNDKQKENDMGLSYHYTFSAPKTITAGELEGFVKKVETAAKEMGFKPTTVVNAAFTTPEEKQFARRLTTGLFAEDDRLKGATLLDESKVWSYDRITGSCRVIPEKGVVLVVTDERGCETVFGFLFYPDNLTDINGKELAALPSKGRWQFRNFVDSPDNRYRIIVRMFAEAGFVAEELDEYAPV
jgi:hypothetical protein